MPIIDITDTKRNIDVNFKMNYDYSNLNIVPTQRTFTQNNVFMKQEMSTTNIFTLACTGKTSFRLKYNITGIYLSRNIHNKKDNDFEIVIEHKLISDDPFNYSPDVKPFEYVYQIFTFKNNNKSPVLIDLKKTVNTKINGNDFLNIHKNNGAFPTIYFLENSNTPSTELIKFLTKKDPSSLFFLWDPIINYQIQNITFLTDCKDAPLNVTSDWSSIYLTKLGISQSVPVNANNINTMLKYIDLTLNNSMLQPKTFSNSKTVFLYSQQMTTDDIYIDCSPVNESVENVNYYLEKLNGKSDSASKQFMGMVINCLIIVLVAGSVFFSAPNVCDAMYHAHTELNKGDGIDYSTKKNEVISGISFGIGFDFVVITIVLMIIGILQNKQELLMLSFLFLIVSFSFIMSVVNSAITGILNPLSFTPSINCAIYILPIPLPWAVLFAMKSMNSMQSVLPNE